VRRPPTCPRVGVPVLSGRSEAPVVAHHIAFMWRCRAFRSLQEARRAINVHDDGDDGRRPPTCPRVGVPVLSGRSEAPVVAHRIAFMWRCRAFRSLQEARRAMGAYGGRGRRVTDGRRTGDGRATDGRTAWWCGGRRATAAAAAAEDSQCTVGALKIVEVPAQNTLRTGHVVGERS